MKTRSYHRRRCQTSCPISDRLQLLGLGATIAILPSLAVSQPATNVNDSVISNRPYYGTTWCNCSALGGVAHDQASHIQATPAAPSTEPDPNEPWFTKGKKAAPAAKQAPPTGDSPTAPAAATDAAATPPAPGVAALPPEGDLTLDLPPLAAPKATMHQIAVSGDYFFGQGDVTLPLGFSLAQSGFAPPGYNPSVVEPDRDAGYFGGTLAYSYGQSWFIELGYSQGDSDGEVNANLGGGFTPPSKFTIDERAYQAYVRYVPKALRGKRLSAYLRAGVTYVDTEITDELVDPLLGFYREQVDATDLLGNLGVGVGYQLYSAGRFRLGVLAEAEGFFGTRQQDITESFPNAPLTLPTATIDNTLYGGIGRGTVHMEYRLGQSGLLRMFADVGVQVKFTQIQYPDDPGFPEDTFSELLWGPYVKLGLSYSF